MNRIIQLDQIISVSYESKTGKKKTIHLIRSKINQNYEVFFRQNPENKIFLPCPLVCTQSGAKERSLSETELEEIKELKECFI